jgi:hypothetical protein
MLESTTVPTKYPSVPSTSGHLSRRVYEMRNPVRVPVADATAVGTTRYSPDVVAVVNRTAWKKSGLPVLLSADYSCTMKHKFEGYALSSLTWPAAIRVALPEM